MISVTIRRLLQHKLIWCMLRLLKPSRYEYDGKDFH
jgi:hypothetical protein